MSERPPGAIRVTGHFLIAPVCANRELSCRDRFRYRFAKIHRSLGNYARGYAAEATP
jgi:hypothetical protein